MDAKTTTINLPPRLAEQIESYIDVGWFPDLNTLVVEALRRYVETHQLELAEHYVWKDVEWGLRGNE